MLDDDVTMVNLDIKGNADLLNQMFADKNFPALEMTSKPMAPPPGTVDNTSDSDSTEEWKKKRSKQSQMDKMGWSDANRASKEATTSLTRSYSPVVSETGGASNRESRLVQTNRSTTSKTEMQEMKAMIEDLCKLVVDSQHNDEIACWESKADATQIQPFSRLFKPVPTG